MSQYLAGKRDLVLGTAIQETAKAIAFAVDGQRRLAWFPKSRATFVKDDFYHDPQDKWAVPAWLVNSRAAELGVLPHYIGG